MTGFGKIMVDVANLLSLSEGGAAACEVTEVADFSGMRQTILEICEVGHDD